LGQDTRDIDLLVRADTLELGTELARCLGGRRVVLDEARNIVRVVLPNGDGPSYVDLSRLDGSLMEDLRRRDFTIDAMAMQLPDAVGGASGEEVIDPGRGLSDLRNGVIRSVAESVFREDPARLMRAPRLAAQLRFRIDDDTAQQIRQSAHLVVNVAAERVRDELLKLLEASAAMASIRLLDSLGLLCRVIPELSESRGVTQPKEHYWDVFNHLVETVGQIERIVQGESATGAIVDDAILLPERIGRYLAEEVSDGFSRLTLLKLAGLLHDIAKPATKTVEDSGRIRFLGHHIEGAEVSAEILKRLRLSGRGTELVRLMVHHHLRPSQMASKGELPSDRAVYRYFRDVGDAAIDTLYLNMADYLAARGPLLGAEEWTEHCRVINHILQEHLEGKAPDSLPKLISGHDIMKSFSMDPGPGVGRLLSLVDEAQGSGDITTREEALELVKINLDSRAANA
jgi:poly(A) polymerase